MTTDAKVEEFIDELGHLRFQVTSDKFKSPFQVVKSPGGFVFFEIKVGNGAVPKELQGQYTRATDAVKHLVSYIDRAKETRSTRRDRIYEEAHAKKERKGS